MFDFDSLVFQTIESILSMPAASQIDKFANEPGFYPIISNYKFPSLSKSENRQIKKYIKSCKIPINFFMQYPIGFSYSKDCINLLINSKTNEISPKLSDFYNKFILYSFLSWIQNYLRNNIDDDILNLMKSLLIYPESLNIDCFFLLYSINTKKHSSAQFSQLFELIKTVCIQKSDKKLPSYSYSLLFSHFAIIRKEEISQNTSSANSENLKYLINILIANPSPIITEIAHELYSLIKSLLLEDFDLQAIEIFANLSTYLKNQTIMETISEFPCKIIDFIEKTKNPYIPLLFDKNEMITDEFFSITLQSKEFTKTLNPDILVQSLKNYIFEGSLKNYKTDYSAFSEKNPKFEIICDKTLISILINISKLIQEKKEFLYAFFNKFINLIVFRVQDKFSLNILASYLILCHINQYDKQNNDLSYSFFILNIWSTDYSIFHSDLDSNKFQIINTLRYFSLNIVLNNESSFLKFFKEAIENPIIITEVSERLQVLHFSLLLNLFGKNNSLLNDTICSTMKLYEQKKDESWFYARYSLFKLLLKLMKEKEIINIISNDSEFWSFFFDLILDFRFEKYTLNEFKIFLIYSNEISKNFIDSFFNFFQKVVDKSENLLGKNNLASTIIQSLYDVLKLKPLFAETFSIIIHSFLECLNNINEYQNEEIQSKLFKFLELIFQYFDYLKDENITKDMITGITLLLNKINSDDNLFNLIINTIVKNKIIIHPKLLQLLISSFWKERNSEIIDLFISYCKYDSNNSKILFEQQIVSKIIDELKSLKLTNEKVEKRLILFEQISLVSSSLKIVDDFICILEQNVNYIPIVEKLFSFNEEIPIFYVPFKIEFKNEFSFDPNKGFTFSIWINLDNEYDGIYISQFDESYKINIYINKCKLFVDNYDAFDIPANNWIFLLFSIKDNSITCTLNNENQKVIPVVKNGIKFNIENVKSFGMHNQILRYKVGDFTNKSGKFGNFGFFPYLEKHQIDYLFKIGPRQLSFHNFKYFKYFSQTEIFNFRSNYLKINEYFNFQQILLQNHRIEFFIKCDHLYKDERTKQNIIILVNCLQFDVLQQNYFYKIGGFKCVYNILMSIDEKYLTYEIYLIFYNLYNKMLNEKLKTSLANIILTNLNLWKGSPELLEITNHWKTILFPKFNQNELIKITDLLILMRKILHYDRTETIFNNQRPINQFYQIAEIRKNMIEILINNYSDLMNDNDIAFLIYNLIDIKDINQVQDLLSFLEHLSQNHSQKFKCFIKNNEIDLLFHILLISDNPHIVKSILRIIFNLKESFENNEIEYLFDIYQFQILYTKISEEFLEEMISWIHDGFEEMFPFCCYHSIMHDLANNKEPNFFLKIFQNIKPLEKTNKSLIWDVWAIYGAIIFKNTDALFYLVRCKNKGMISHIYFLIDRICRIFNFDVNYHKCKLLDIISIYISQEQVESDYVKEFYDLAFDFIFCRKYNFNPALLNLFNKFYDDVKVAKEFINEIKGSESNILNEMIDILNHYEYFLPSKQKTKEIDSINIFKKIIDNCLFEEKFVFGIKVNEYNEWIDRELAQNIIQVFDKNCIKSYKKMNAILCNFNYYYKKIHFSLIEINDFIDIYQENHIKNKPNEHFNLIRHYLYDNVINRIKKILTKNQFCEKHKIDEVVFNDPTISIIEDDENSLIIVNNDPNENNNNNDDILTTTDSFEIKFNQTEQKLKVKPMLNFIDTKDMKNMKKIEKIGEGTQSKVYKVIFYQKEVALKVLKFKNDEEDKLKFINFFQEYEIVNSLNHPNIIKAIGAYMICDRYPPFILFELQPYNLFKIVKYLKDVERVTIIYEICLAMNEIHKSNMIHRDLKPQNILLDEKKHVKINDFGISRLISVETQMNTMTSGVGTFIFMSPEMLNQDKHYTNKVDVYSFGVVVFFILTNGDFPSHKICDAANGNKVPIPNCINKVSAYLIDWCMSFKADERPSFSQIITFINNQQFNLIDGVDIKEIKQFLSS